MDVALERWRRRGVTMVERTIKVLPEGELVITSETLERAELGHSLRLVIRRSEIRILPGTPSDPEQELADLAGCLGQEPAAEYDFGVKNGISTIMVALDLPRDLLGVLDIPQAQLETRLRELFRARH